MFRFAHPEYLYALAVLPLILLVYFYHLRWKTKARKQFGDLALVERLAPNVSKTKPIDVANLLIILISSLHWM